MCRSVSLFLLLAARLQQVDKLLVGDHAVAILVVLQEDLPQLVNLQHCWVEGALPGGANIATRWLLLAWCQLIARVQFN